MLALPTGALRVPELSLEATGDSDSILFSLVIPTYNEAANVKKIVSVLSHVLDESIPGDYELIIDRKSVV